MTATTTAVEDLATDLERLAEMYLNRELDTTETFLSLVEMVPHLFGEDLWAAFEKFFEAVRLRNQVHDGTKDWTAVDEDLKGMDKNELAMRIPAERVDEARQALIGGAG